MGIGLGHMTHRVKFLRLELLDSSASSTDSTLAPVPNVAKKDRWLADSVRNSLRQKR